MMHVKYSSKFYINLLCILCEAVPMLVFFAFNMLTPFWWDDFKMAAFFKETGGWLQVAERPLKSFSDVVVSTYNMYMTHHGRSPVDFVNFLFMFAKHKIIFNICNTIVYCLFIFLMCFHIIGFKSASASISNKNTTRSGSTIPILKFSLLFLLVNVLLWMLMPGWGQDFLWLTGSINYLWTSTMILLFLVPYRKKWDNPSYDMNIAFSILWFFAGLLAGWSMENSAAGCAAILFVYFILRFVNVENKRLVKRKPHILLFEILGAIGFIIGFLLLINSRENLSTTFSEILMRFVYITKIFILYGKVILVLLVLLSLKVIFFHKKKISSFIYLYFIAALASVYSLLLATYFAERAFMMIGVFLIITLLSLSIDVLSEIKKRYILIPIVCLTVLFVPSFLSGAQSIFDTYMFSAARDQYIYEQKAKGVADIKVKAPIPVRDNHCGLYGGQDFIGNPRNTDYKHQNGAKSLWYGANISAENVRLTLMDYLRRKKSDNLTSSDLYKDIYKKK
ncbi:MAG: hypothetical protein Ta2B_26590 [Termitinemataceae bacterium]|nr:MAG: hypothetical protein Ta2B_26590 [Termitinemataceae bacterium]